MAKILILFDLHNAETHNKSYFKRIIFEKVENEGRPCIALF